MVFILILLSTACLSNLSLGLNAACLVHNVIFHCIRSRTEWFVQGGCEGRVCLRGQSLGGSVPPVFRVWLSSEDDAMTEWLVELANWLDSLLRLRGRESKGFSLLSSVDTDF